jgi:hypothetical protein
MLPIPCYLRLQTESSGDSTMFKRFKEWDMVPFRVYDKSAREMWIVLNYHSKEDAYLLAREDDSDADGEMKIVSSRDMTKFKLVDFLDEAEEL